MTQLALRTFLLKSDDATQTIARLILLVLLTCFQIQSALATPADHFVTTWKTDNPGASNTTSITVPMVGGPYDVDWDNDGTFDEIGLTGPVTHDYMVAGIKTLRISGIYESIKFATNGDKRKILTLDQWGTQTWVSMEAAFWGASNLTIPASDTPDFSAVTNMSDMFFEATLANPDTSGWNTAAVTNMRSMFSRASTANPDTSGWNTAAVTDMSWMFGTAKVAKPDTSGWITSSVTNMMAMFQSAQWANPDTSGWDTSGVLYMGFMFSNAYSANPDTSGWDTSNVVAMQSMFSSAVSANPNTSGWDTSALENTENMFRNALSFDGNIGSWNVTALTNATGMFTGITLSIQNYDSLLSGWDTQALHTPVTFDGGNSNYCSAAAVAARANMIAAHAWSISDGGLTCSPTDPILAPDLTPASDTGISDNDDLTSDNTPGFFVQCSAVGNTITLYTNNPVVNTATGTHECITPGTETATVAAPLLDGIHSVFYTDRIHAGESGPSPALTITVSNAPPTPASDFVTTWKTDNPGASNATSITVPMVGGPYNVDWDDDGTFDEFGLTGSATHDYGLAGTHTIRLRGNYDSILFLYGGENEKILSVDQWGTNTWRSMAFAFRDAINLTLPATDTPDFSAVTSMQGMFNGADLANPDTSSWDTSAVIYMTSMFSGAVSANPDTSNWDTAAVAYMTFMFWNADLANPDTSGWNTSAVTDMYGMFALAESAQPDTSGWNTSAVTNMSAMFWNASSANPNTSGWNTGAVKYMNQMFMNASSANPDTSGWNTGAVKYMREMFSGATTFDRDIGSWDIRALTTATGMFSGVTLSTVNYESLLIGWDAQALHAGLTFDGGNSRYCSAAAATARANMIASDSWVISDGGLCGPPFCAYFVGQPIGGENWIAGNTYSINWSNTGNNCAATVEIELYRTGVLFQSIIMGTNDTSFEWEIPVTQEVGYDYRIRVIDSDDQSYSAKSTTDFTINAPTCDLNIVSGQVVTANALHEACDLLLIGPSFVAKDGTSISLSGGQDIIFEPGFSIEPGTTLDVSVCGQSLCETGDAPLPYGCHSCVDQICDIDPLCCDVQFDRACLGKVASVCGLSCDEELYAITGFGATPVSITEGESTILSWATVNLTSCVPSGGAGGWSSLPVELPSGNTQLTISTAGTYEFNLTCQNAAGNSTAAHVNVTVIPSGQECISSPLVGELSSWNSLWGVNFPKPAYDTETLTVPLMGYQAVFFETGDIVDYGGVLTVENTTTTGSRLGSISKCQGDFDVAPECKHVWGASGGIGWATDGKAGYCQLESDTTYYLNLTFTDGADPTTSDCVGELCVVTLWHINLN